MSSSTADRAAIAGAWELVSWRLLGPNGAVTEPFGPAPRGRLIYTDDGHMSVVISARDRPRLADDPALRSNADRAAAYDTVHAYAGRWWLEGDTIVHRVTMASMPAYEGTDQRRHLVLDHDLLTLTTPPGRAAHIAPGSAIVGQLVWRRVEPVSDRPRR